MNNNENPINEETEIIKGKPAQDIIDNKINLLEEQIHHINIKLNSPEKTPWLKKNASLVISIAALVTSMSFNFFGIYKQKIKDEGSARSAKIEKVEQLTLKLTELAERNFKLASENPNTNINALSVLLNYQRLIYLNEILKIMEDLNENFPSDIYALIGNELRNDGQFEKALKYYKLELMKSQSHTARVVAYRDLANIFGILNTPIFNKDSSHFFWIKSLDESENILGEQKYYYKGYTYQLWAGAEFYFGNSKVALKLIDSAKQQYLKLPDNNSAKHFNMGQLSQMIEYEDRKVIDKSFFGLTGEWNTNGKSDTKANMHFSKNLNGWYCNMEIYDGDKVIYSMSGPLISVGKNHMTFTMQGMKRLEPVNMYNDRTQFLGSVKIYPGSNRENILTVRLNEINGSEKNFLVYKY